jgi:hypothetical protein
MMALPKRDSQLSQIAAGFGRNETRVTRFRPNPGGQEVLMACPKHEIIVSGANACGKTYCGIMLCAWHIIEEKDKLGNPTGYTIHPHLRLRVPRSGIEGWISSYSEKVQHSNIKAVYDKILGPYENQGNCKTKTEGGVRHWAEFPGGRILFKWQTRGVQGYQGDKVNFAHLDEPHKPNIYNETKLRLPNKGGYMWNTATYVMNEQYTDLQLSDVMWMQKEIIQKWIREPDKEKVYPETQVIFIGMAENAAYTDFDLALALTANMGEEERDTRLYGKIVGHIGTCWFDREKLGTITSYLRANPEVAVPQYGHLFYDYDESNDDWKIVFNEDIRDFPDNPKDEFCIKIWQHPIGKNTPFIRPEYFIGVDAAEGKRGGDYTAVCVIRGDTGEEVAALHGHLSEIELARQLYMLGMYYCTSDYEPAMLGIEINGIGKATLSYCINGLPTQNIPPYGISRLYHRPSATDMERGVGFISNDPGWYTNPRTRPMLTAAMREIILRAYEGIADPRDGQEPFSIIKDIYLVDSEAQNFVLSKRGRYEAREGVDHDDRLFARAIAEMVKNQYSTSLRETPSMKHASTDKFIVDLNTVSISMNDAVLRPPKRQAQRLFI